MGNIHEYKIDIDVKENLLITVICKQMDNINFIFNVWDNGLQAELSNYNCRLKALKSDYVPLIQNTGITISKNIISIIADEQLTTTSGIVKAELQFIDKITGEKKSTFNLSLKVVASVLEVDRTISKSTVTLLEDLDNKLDQIADISDILDEAKEVKEELKIDIVTSNTVKDNLNTCIHNADTKKQEIETVTNNVDNKKLEVETSINNVNTAKMELDTSKSNADKTKINLDNANIQAEKNIEELNKLGDVTDLAEKVQINTTDITQLKTDASNNTTQLNENTQNIENIQERFSGFKIYHGVTSLNPNFGQSTSIVNLVQTMPENSVLIYNTSGANNNVYPTENGLLLIIKETGVYRNVCRWHNQSGHTNGGFADYIGYVNNTDWSGWKQLTTAEIKTSSVAITNGTVTYGVNLLRKNGRFVEIDLIINVDANSTVAIGTIPVGYRPSKDFHSIAIQYVANNQATAVMHADGLLELKGNGKGYGAINYAISFCYMTEE